MNVSCVPGAKLCSAIFQSFLEKLLFGRNIYKKYARVALKHS